MDSGDARRRIGRRGRWPRRDLVVAVLVALALGGFLVFGILSLRRELDAGWARGRIVEKEFIPRPERQITIGRGGLGARELEGVHRLHVIGAEDGRRYHVDVDKSVFDASAVGDSFRFVPPPDGELAPEASADPASSVP